MCNEMCVCVRVCVCVTFLATQYIFFNSATSYNGPSACVIVWAKTVYACAVTAVIFVPHFNSVQIDTVKRNDIM